MPTITVTDRQLDTILAALRWWQTCVPNVHPETLTIAVEHGSRLDDREIDALCEAINLDADQPVIAHRGCGLCGSTALPDSKLCGPCAGVVDRGPSAETLARECGAAVAERLAGDPTPGVRLNTFACGCVGTDCHCPMHQDGEIVPVRDLGGEA